MIARRSRPRLATLALALTGSVAFLFSACEAPRGDSRAAGAPNPAAVAAQACSEQLHELSEQLLLHHAQHGLLPDDLADAHADGAFKATCPSTNTVYRYNASGWPTDRAGEYVVLCDATPVHMGRRLGLVVQPGEPGAPLVLRVTTLDLGFVPE